MQKDTLARRRELATVSRELSEQERLTAQDIRNKERLVDLVERYGAGDWVARHLKVELEKFRHRTQRNPGLSADQEPLGRRLREYRQTLFELGTLLFRVDAEAGDYARALAAEGQPSPAVRSRLDRPRRGSQRGAAGPGARPLGVGGPRRPLVGSQAPAGRSVAEPVHAGPWTGCCGCGTASPWGCFRPTGRSSARRWTAASAC